MTGGLLEHRYQIGSLVARGGMSAVYRGVDTRLDRPVAIKVMDSRFSADPSFVARFEGEARTAARLHHPGVVAVHDQGVDEDRVFLVMELVEGGTLRDLLVERGRLEPALALSVLERVLAALAAAHRADLVHRDVKPENVLIGADGVVKVADFGLARAMSGSGITSDSVIMGTVAYLSPEQVATGAADARSDVYQAGIVLYEMLTGAPPYVGDSAISVAYRHVNDVVPPVEGVPAEVAELVRRATRKEPFLRPADAAAFLAEVEAARTKLGLAAVQVPLPTTRTPLAAPAPFPGAPLPPSTSQHVQLPPATSQRVPLPPSTSQQVPLAPGVSQQVPLTPSTSQSAPVSTSQRVPLPPSASQPVATGTPPGGVVAAAGLGTPAPGFPAQTPPGGFPAPGTPASGFPTGTPPGGVQVGGVQVGADGFPTSTPPGGVPAAGTPAGGVPVSSGAHAKPDADDEATVVGGPEETLQIPPVTGTPAGGFAEPTLPVARPKPGGPTGPQGTMALARPGVMPSAPPAPAPKPRKPKAQKKTPEQVLEEERQRSKRQFITWTSVAVVAAVLAGVIGWWMAAGRYADVPELVGKQESEVSTLMGDASLKFVTAMEASDTVPKGEVLRTEPAAGTELMRGDLVRITVSLGRPVVPQLKSNLDVAVAQQELKLVGLEGEVNEAENAYSATVPVGKVVTLKPEPGTQVPIGTKITIVLSKGPEPKPVPDVVGKSKADAFAELTAAGFEPVEGKAEFAQGVEEGKVIRITPAAGTNVPEGDKKVTVVVSGGAVTVPEVKGKRVKDARKDLEKLGLEVEVQFNGSDRARVFSQSPDAGAKVEKGSRVTLVGI